MAEEKTGPEEDKVGKGLVDAALRLHRVATTDEERFAALLLLSRAPERHDRLADVFAAMRGDTFVARLVRSTVPLHRSLAAGILAFFSRAPLTHTMLIPLLPAVAAVLANDEHEARAEALIALYNVATGSEAGHMATVALASPMFWDALSALLLDRTVEAPVARLAADTLTAVAGVSAATVSEVTGRLWNIFAEPDAHVFSAASALVQLLPRHQGVRVPQPAVARLGLLQCLGCKLGPDSRRVCLQLAALAVEATDPDWLCPVGEGVPKLLLLTTHLACVELRMHLEDRDPAHMITEEPLVSSCFVLVENAIRLLTQSDAALRLEGEVFLKLHTALAGGIGAVAAAFQSLSPDFPNHASLRLACIRMLGVWLSEETESMQDELADIAPQLLTAARTSADALRFLLPGCCHFSAEQRGAKMLVDQEFDLFLAQWLVTDGMVDDVYSCISALRVLRNILVQLPRSSAHGSTLHPLLSSLLEIADGPVRAAATVVTTFLAMLHVPSLVLPALARHLEWLLALGLNRSRPTWWELVDDLWVELLELLLSTPEEWGHIGLYPAAGTLSAWDMQAVDEQHALERKFVLFASHSLTQRPA